MPDLERDKRIFDLWLACSTQEQIGEEVGLGQQTIQEILPKMADLPKPVKPAAEYLVNFERPREQGATVGAIKGSISAG